MRVCLCVSGERAGEKAIPRSLNHNPAAGKLQIYKPGQQRQQLFIFCSRSAHLVDCSIMKGVKEENAILHPLP